MFEVTGPVGAFSIAPERTAYKEGNKNYRASDGTSDDNPWGTTGPIRLI